MTKAFWNQFSSVLDQLISRGQMFLLSLLQWSWKNAQTVERSDTESATEEKNKQKKVDQEEKDWLKKRNKLMVWFVHFGCRTEDPVSSRHSLFCPLKK